MALAHDAHVIPETDNSVRTSAETGPAADTGLGGGFSAYGADFPDLTDLEKDGLGMIDRFSFFALSSA